MKFSQQRVIENVYRILKEEGRPVSNFESAIGVSVGYLSKLRKGALDDSPTISLDTLTKILMELDVTLEYMLIDPDQNTQDQERLIVFFSRVLNDTDSGSIDWMKGTWQVDLEKSGEDFFTLNEFHPIIQVIDNWDADGERMSRISISLWNSDESRSEYNYCDVNVEDYCKAVIPNLNATLFLYRIDCLSKNGKTVISNKIEAYLMSNQKERFFLADTSFFGDGIESMLRNLYKTASAAAMQRRLDSKVRNLIDRYNQQAQRKDEKPWK